MLTFLSKKEQHLRAGLSSVLNFWEMQVKTGLKQTAASLCPVESICSNCSYNAETKFFALVCHSLRPLTVIASVF